MKVYYTVFHLIFPCIFISTLFSVDQTASSLISVSNESNVPFNLAFNIKGLKKVVSSIKPQETWRGSFPIEHTINLISSDEATHISIQQLPTYVAITTFSEQRPNQKNKVQELRLNIDGIFQNSAALLKKVSMNSNNVTARDPGSPWSLELVIDSNKNPVIKNIVFDKISRDGVELKAAKIPGFLLESYITTIKP